MAEMATGCEAHRQQALAWAEQCEEHGLVGLRPRVRLDVHVGGTEQRLGSLDRQTFDDVDVLLRRHGNDAPG